MRKGWSEQKPFLARYARRSTTFSPNPVLQTNRGRTRSRQRRVHETATTHKTITSRITCGRSQVTKTKNADTFLLKKNSCLTCESPPKITLADQNSRLILPKCTFLRYFLRSLISVTTFTFFQKREILASQDQVWTP